MLVRRRADASLSFSTPYEAEADCSLMSNTCVAAPASHTLEMRGKTRKHAGHTQPAHNHCGYDIKRFIFNNATLSQRGRNKTMRDMEDKQECWSAYTQTLPLTNVAHCHNWSPSLGLADSQPARCEGLSAASIIRQKHKPQIPLV
ncbi:hypothetical protein ATANTOWER_009652 [Ataeniobius toweri]|uniref:Uncharacterized protein n=1 Tax=Ataeniobius toweri TaxID=208326 RepID=A0ABU7AWY2_9TELE|nr:hypothetical protein [Ataeniobius toweri]